MNRYPLWKYIVIGVALAFGLLYMLPNFFPEVPAVQVSTSKSTAKVDTALLGTVEDALKGASIPYRGAALDPTGIKVRFDDPDTQLKAKDVLQGRLGDDYIVALNLLSSSPHWLAAVGRFRPRCAGRASQPPRSRSARPAPARRSPTRNWPSSRASSPP